MQSAPLGSSGAGQTHVLAVQDAAASQAVPHDPQSVIVASERSQPLASSPSQFPHEASQLAMRHDPVEHVGVAFARVHATPHAPQLDAVLSEVSQPFEGTPSQSAQPAAHASTQAPEVHALPVACATPVGQMLPHAPQLVIAVSDVSHPFAADASQLPQPVSHEAIAHVPVAHVAVA